MNEHTSDSTADISSDKCGISKQQGNYSVLYHLIDGYVIEEADTPFALDTGSLLTKQQLRDIWKKQQELMAEEIEKVKTTERMKINPKVEPFLPDQRCEGCGTVGNQHYSPQFCAIGCMRRYNASRARMSRWKSGQSKQKNYDMEENIDSAKTRLFESPPVSPSISPVQSKDGTNTPISPSKWSVDDVCNFIDSIPDAKYFVKDFRENEIDGSALLLLKEDHLIHTLNIKLGPALKLCSHIRKLME